MPDTASRLDPGDGPVPEANQPGHHPDVEQDKPVGRPPRAKRFTDEHRFEFAFAPTMAPFSALVGVTPWTSRVVVGPDGVDIRFGPWHMHVPDENIAAASVTGPYNPLKVVGPPHLSRADHGITFATNTRRGVCIRFRTPQTGIDPWGKFRHPAVTVTVKDPVALADLVSPLF